jgi:flagellar biosynthesis protein FlhF
MHIRKFEARTMKEALEMVKAQLGPEAIILSARDNQKRFGLVGQNSFEITAAVPEETLHQKKFAESRLRPEDRERLSKSSARMQKQVIQQMVHKYTHEKEEKVPRPLTRTRYIEIDDESQGGAPLDAAAERIKNAASLAWNAFTHEESNSIPQAKVNPQPAPTQQPLIRHHIDDPSQVRALKGEIEQLKQVISQFQKVPQMLQATGHPGSVYGLPYECSPTFEKLVQAGVSEELAAKLLEDAATKMPPLKLKNKALVDAFVAKKILDETLIAPKSKSQIHVFVGPGGSGKTSSLVKMASHLVVNEGKKIAIVTTDNLKVGAQDQMRIYAHILNVPFAAIRNKLDWPRIMSQLSSYDHVLVDTAGVSLKTMEEISSIRQMIPPDSLKPQVHLVMNTLTKDSDLAEIGKRFQVTGFGDVIFTAIDESAQHGSIYNFMKRFEVPLHSFGIGARVPEDFEIASKERLLDLIFKITKMNRMTSVEGGVA